MQNFYRNSSPFSYNRFYRNNFIPQTHRAFSPNYSGISNCNNFPKDHLNNVVDNSNTSNKISHNSIEQNLPPNKDFVLDLFGIKLYFDDVLILSLLYFLYKEDVKDEGLFLSLVLLLIS